jgi:hypothetical protein
LSDGAPDHRAAPRLRSRPGGRKVVSKSFKAPARTHPLTCARRRAMHPGRRSAAIEASSKGANHGSPICPPCPAGRAGGGQDRVPGRGVRSVSRSGRRVIVSGLAGERVRLRVQTG